MSGISERDSNPYVGPRSIQTGERLYGRDREVLDLYDRLQARRIVVLHSPSGAGKSSLVQAGLVPKLREGKFDVWRPIRVNLDPTGLDGVAPSCNRYALSMMLSLEEELPEPHRRSSATLSHMSVSTYLETRPRRKKQLERPVVLLFDQFEEVLTVAPNAIADKQAFFDDLGAALGHERYWALFVIREDFLAAFAPYRDRLPTQMLNTFRLDLLGLDGAREAALRPALSAGRTFPAVDLLIRDLSTVRIQQSDGSFVAEQGLHVEPVQLQVVCRRLWAAMPEEARSIDADNIAKYASVSESLAGYYAQSVSDVARGDLGREREIREWVGEKLIVAGIRSQVRQGAGASGGLDNELIRGLLSNYLVRTEQRAGANWFELSHDRLVEPVARDNAAWEQENLHPLQVQARLWEHNRRDAGLLLSDEALHEAVTWAKSNAARMTNAEREFLELSQQHRAKQRAQRRRQAALTGTSIVVAMMMAGLVKWARDNQHEAEDARERARHAQLESERYAAELAVKFDELAAQNAKIMALTPGKQIPGLIRALGALADVGAGQPSRTLEAGIFAATRSLHDVWELQGHEDNIIDVDFAPDGRLFASAGRDHRVLVWSAEAPHERRAVLAAHQDDVTHVEFSSTNERLLTVGDDRKVFIWDLPDLGHEKPLDPGCPVRAARLSPDGHTAALACDTEVCLWSLTDDQQHWLEFDGQVESLEWAPTGTHLLATAGNNLALATLNSSEVTSFDGHHQPITTIGFSPDGSKFVSGDAGGVALLWASPAGTQIAALDDAHGEIERAVFSPDGSRLVIVDATSTPTLWQLDGDLAKTRLLGHGAQVADAAFSRDGERLATVGYDQTLRLWAASSGAAQAVLEAPNTPLLVAFSPTEDKIVTGELTGASKPMVRVWDVESSTRRVVVDNPPQVAAVALSGDGGRAAMAEAQRIRIWDTQTGQLRNLEHADVMQIEISPSGRKLAARDMTRWRVWDIDGGTELVELPSYISAVTFSGVDEALVTVDLADRVGLWTSMAELGPPKDVELNYYASLVVSPTGMLAGARRKGRVSLWESVSGPTIGDFDEVANYVINELEFSPSGRWLAITSQQKMVWLLDVKDMERRTLQTDNPLVGAIAFSPDERHVLVGNGTAVTLWSIDAEQPEVIATIGQHERAVEAAAYAADGRTAVTTSKDGLVIAWLTTAEDRRILACELVAHSPVAYGEALGSCR